MRFDGTRTASFPLFGGLDLVSPHTAIKPGRLIACNNFEAISGRAGYSRPDGFERCTDDILPSETKWYSLDISSISGNVAENDVFVNGTFDIVSLQDISVSSGRFVFASMSEPQTGMYSLGGVSFNVDSVVSDLSGYSVEQIRSFTDKAIESTRSRIPLIPGAGQANGVFRLKGINYVFRGGTLYKGEKFSWSAIQMQDILQFKEGTVKFTVGDTVTDGTATGIITSVTLQKGAWNASLPAVDQAQGYMTIKSVSGSFTAELSLSDGHTGAAKVDSANYTYTLPAGGKYECVIYNFTNIESKTTCYGVSGVGEAFEFDGENYIPIFVPDATTHPYHVLIHQDRLHLAFPGGERVYSVSGQPRVFNPLLGSGVHSSGDEIVGMMTIHGNASITLCRGSKWLLLGDGVYSDDTSTRNWSYYEHDSNLGADEWSLSGKDYPIFVNGSDIYLFVSTNTSGSYRSVPVGGDVEPILPSKNGDIVGSVYNIEKSQYRVFFENGVILYMAMSGTKVSGITRMTLPEKPVNIFSVRESGKDITLFVSDSGYLYRMDSGNSFDSSFIEGSLRLPFYHYGNPRIEKTFNQLTVELDAPVLLTNNTEITITTNHNYGNPATPRPIAETVSDIAGGGGLYDNNYGYGNFVWSEAVVTEIYAYLDGYGSNMSILITYKTKNDGKFSFLTAIVDYIELGLKGRD